MKLFEQYSSQINELCKRHKVRELYAFGSVLTDDFNPDSDVDLLEYFDNYMDLKEAFEKLFGRPVDLVENQAVKNPIFRKMLDRYKKLLYSRLTMRIELLD